MDFKEHQNRMNGPNAGGSHFHSLGLRLGDGKQRSLSLELRDTKSGGKYEI